MRRTVRPLLIAAAWLSVLAASCVGGEPAIPSGETEGGAVAEGGGTADVTVHDATSEAPGADSAAGDGGGQDTGPGADGGPDATVEAGPEAGADAGPDVGNEGGTDAAVDTTVETGVDSGTVEAGLGPCILDMSNLDECLLQ